MARFNPNKEEIDKIIKMKDSGISCKNIGIEFGVSESPIYRILRENGIKLKSSNVAKVFSDEQLKNIIKMKIEGFTMRYFSVEFLNEDGIEKVSELLESIRI